MLEQKQSGGGNTPAREGTSSHDLKKLVSCLCQTRKIMLYRNSLKMQ